MQTNGGKRGPAAPDGSEALDGGWRKRSFTAKSPAVSPYRRQVQRSYVTLLLTATETIEDPAARSAHIASASIDGGYADSGVRTDPESLLRRSRSFDSAIAKIGEQYAAATGPLSEYRAVLRAAVAELYKKIDAAMARTRDADTLLHLRLLRGQLGNVP